MKSSVQQPLFWLGPLTFGAFVSMGYGITQRVLILHSNRRLPPVEAFNSEPFPGKNLDELRLFYGGRKADLLALRSKNTRDIDNLEFQDLDTSIGSSYQRSMTGAGEESVEIAGAGEESVEIAGAGEEETYQPEKLPQMNSLGLIKPHSSSLQELFYSSAIFLLPIESPQPLN